MKTKLALIVFIILFGLTAWVLRSRTSSPIQYVICGNIEEPCKNAPIRIVFENPPSLMKPFGLQVEDKEASEVHATFLMQGMEMGLNRYRLLKTKLGIWHADVTLPVCVQGRSDWHVLVESQTPEGLKKYQYQFQLVH